MGHSPSDWLRHYGNTLEYQWQRKHLAGEDVFCRPSGLVECSFDGDGRHWEGRADMNCQIHMHIKSTLKSVEFRERVLLAWTWLRCRHLMIQSRTMQEDASFEPRSFAPLGLWFAVPVHESVSRAIEGAGRHVVFLEDRSPGPVDARDFFVHTQNASRVVDPDVALAKAFVLPLREEGGRTVLTIHFVFAHQIADGLSANVWMRDLIQALNLPVDALKADIIEAIKPESMKSRLPLPQEALYPPIAGSKARQRWFWAITRILRHVRTPLAVGFHNPLQRPKRLPPTAFPPTYHAAIDYTRTPPLNSIPVWIHVSARNTQRLHRLAREANASIGAAIYALAALCMMEFHERQHPTTPPRHRPAFIAGFPLDPRAFFPHHGPDPDSMMLAFSDGIALPFLPADRPVAGRIRLLARSAQRQLSAYQKRPRPRGPDAPAHFLRSRGAALVLANQYLYSLERIDAVLPARLRAGAAVGVQGAYPARQNPTPQTCGVSSIGNRELQIRGGVYPVDDPDVGFAADFLDMSASVRARDGEFLVGIGGTKDGLFCTPSIDMSTMDPILVERWKHRFEHALDEVDSNESKL